MILVTSRGCILIKSVKDLVGQSPPSVWMVGMVWLMDSVMHCVVGNLEICCLVLGSVGVPPSHTREHGARSGSAMPSVSRNPAHTLHQQHCHAGTHERRHVTRLFPPQDGSCQASSLAKCFLFVKFNKNVKTVSS